MDAMVMGEPEATVSVHLGVEVQVEVTEGHIAIAATRAARAERAVEPRALKSWWKN